ncbi:hypothetical protein CPAR01_01234 [Colletotrichum paranaense]|uniref:Uncharacterized protein n=4 Tax=Colletotrichum acutatum species complex TaxID=2707335 RepID=A0AAI9Z0B5_9PEZI|nr:uncharacterized protein CCOS01_06860 [Colletotrichum costaricense]XP_060356380.1 uncharacterized protein CPAR01_01234 [Colletotrichum paranaense]XP_060387983.1 uncharacterized protein CTAM01_01480 [Colletotrichum tamarilloi]KAI3539598.1 hypothetical protein CSPX01_08814 [Colletotrichum filicis]KAK0367557.1 hypothetical protein CLIM01_15086 [Colletotrichum limetticola]KAK1510907.1 hypothetical protein CTAM01_01480 [Colletotrichum tamarilloi]KAK1529026.1 hypothetical protein CCOS01_06860 [Co
MSSPVDNSVFLSLAPTTSSSYPFRQQQQAAAAVTATTTEPAPLKRRTSSMSSDGSNGLRFLKLGPVHYGEHPDEHKSDWHPALLG